MANLDHLPKLCAARHPVTKKPIMIIAGEKGYHPASPDFDVETFNQQNQISEAQVTAMIAGSMFGFDVPGADPYFYVQD